MIEELKGLLERWEDARKYCARTDISIAEKQRWEDTIMELHEKISKLYGEYDEKRQN